MRSPRGNATVPDGYIKDSVFQLVAVSVATLPYHSEVLIIQKLIVQHHFAALSHSHLRQKEAPSSLSGFKIVRMSSVDKGIDNAANAAKGGVKKVQDAASAADKELGVQQTSTVDVLYMCCRCIWSVLW